MIRGQYFLIIIQKENEQPIWLLIIFDIC